jgi:serine/threonine-protein kinase HipA
MKKKNKALRGNKKIKVFLKFSEEEIPVGKLILHNRLIHFKYEEDFLNNGMNLSPLKLAFNNKIQVAAPIPFNGIFGLFDDSLPDGWGKLLLNRVLEKKGLSLEDTHLLDQLAYIGDRGKGALVYRPAIETERDFNESIDLDQLKTSVDEVYQGSSTEVIDKLMYLGGASGGARPKANVGYNPLTNELMHGYNNLPKGFSHWIIKFPGVSDPIDIANIEYAYYKMAIAAKISMSESKLLESTKGLQIFATKRFDRTGNDRIHMHSMAGLSHDNFRRSNIDYGHIIDLAFRLEKSAQAREKVLRLAAFNVYSHNRDDHSKNFSWLMNASGLWSLAPAYDLTFSSTGMGEHSTRVHGEGEKPGRKQLLELAEIFSINKANEIINEVQQAIAQWPDIARESDVRPLTINRIQNRLLELKD